jgi:hypothetical protein
MTVKGAFTVDLSGPYVARGSLLEAFAAASISARYTASQAVGPNEETKGWVRAEFHEGTDSPSSEFQQDCLRKSISLGEQFGYVLRSHGVVIGAAPQMSHIVDKRTGALVSKGFNLTDDSLGIFAEQLGVPVEFLELREPSGVWDVPTE